MGASQLTASAMAMMSPASSEGSNLAGGAPVPLELMQNRVKDSKSPFLAAAGSSPVAWQPLDDAAVERARKENKLIYLHIGYQACHHCHLMTSDSFNNTSCASIINTNFIPVLVDREQRPDIDTVYMNYVQGITNTGGWPLNVFVTAEMEPVFGGTYFPGPGASHPSSDDDKEEAVADFLTVLKKVRDAWLDQEARCRKEAAEVMTQLRDFAAEGTLGSRTITLTSSLGASVQSTAAMPVRPARPERKGSMVSTELDLDQLEEAYRKLAGTFDPFDGGFGLPPKFPTPPKLSFLLSLSQPPTVVQDVVGEEECKHARKIVLDTLRKIRDGAMRDHIGGNGFARFSVTSDWSVPNFERITPDNAGLLALYHEAWLVSGGRPDSEFYDVVSELVHYFTSSPICLPAGGFASSQAAASLAKRGDRNPREGAYYTWTSREFESVVAPAEETAAGLVAARFGVLEDGNVGQQYDPNDDFINQNIIRITKPLSELSKQFNLSVEDVQKQIDSAKKMLREKMDRERQRPAVDDKVVTGWNGLVISALARVAANKGSATEDLSELALTAATKAVTYIKDNLWDGQAKQLYRIGKHGRETAAFADDHAYLILGLLDLYSATSDESHLQFANVLQETQNQKFRDEARAGFFSTTTDYPHSPIRLKDGMDTSLPSVNAVSVENLFRLSSRYPDAGYKDLAEETINAFEPELLQYPWLYPGLLRGVVTARLLE